MKKIWLMLAVVALLAVAGGVSKADEVFDVYNSGNLLRDAKDGYPGADLYEFLDENLYDGHGKFSLIYTYNEDLASWIYQTWDWMSDYAMFTLYFGTYTVTPGSFPPDYLRKGVNPNDFRARKFYKTYGNYTNLDTTTNNWTLLTKSEVTQPEEYETLLSTYDYEAKPAAPPVATCSGSTAFAVNYGSSYGLFRYSDGWTKIHSAVPDGYKVDNAGNVIAYFAGYGLYKYDGSWARLNGDVAPVSIDIDSDNNLIVD